MRDQILHLAGAAAALGAVYYAWQRTALHVGTSKTSGRSEKQVEEETEERPRDIFISYGRGESTPLVQRFAQGLSERGFTVFVDTGTRQGPAIPTVKHTQYFHEDHLFTAAF